MKILVSIPGEAYTIPMNRFVPEALRELGHEVIVYNHERNGVGDRVRKLISKQQFDTYKCRSMVELVKEEKPDLFFAIYGRLYQKEVLDQLRSLGVVTACWWLNDPFELGYKYHDVSAFDYYFSNSRYARDLYEEKGVKKHFFLPVGYSPTVAPVSGKQPIFDLVFAGDAHPIRAEFIQKLSSKYSIGLMGPWKKTIKKLGGFGANVTVLHDTTFTPAQMAETFALGKINLNLHTWYGRFDYGVNPRLMEAAGLRSFQLVDYKREVETLFEPEKEVVQFSNFKELTEKIDYYLSHETERLAIVEAAHKRTMKDHTYAARMQYMLDCIRL